MMTLMTTVVDRKARPVPARLPCTGISLVPERFRCEADRRASRVRIDLAFEDIGEELLSLRKQAFDTSFGRSLWNVPGHATRPGMKAVANALRSCGSMRDARLGSAILEAVARREMRAS